MSIKVPDEIQPMNGLDFGLMRDKYLIGGYHVVANTTLRDAIDESVRVEGMKVRVTSDGTEYVLGSDLTTWTETSSGGTSRPSPPETIFIRQYINYVAIAIANIAAVGVSTWKARFPNAGFCILIQDPSDAPSLASCASSLAQLHAYGIPAFPGFRCNASGGTAAWFDAGKFDTLASWFTAVWALRADTTEMRFSFDIENYGLPDNGQLTPAQLVGLGKTRADLVVAMQPLLDAINVASAASASNVIPCIHPTVVDPDTREPDQVMDILVENADGVAEIFSEESFGNINTTRETGDEGTGYARLAAANIRRELENMYPKAKVRFGIEDSVYRRWQGPIFDPADGIQTEAGKLFSEGLWVFDLTRRDNSVFMSTTSYWNGYPTLNALNDISHCFPIGELNLVGIPAHPPGSTVPVVLHGWVNDSLNDSGNADSFATRKGLTLPGQPGTLTTDTVGLRESVSVIPFTGSPTWTIDGQFYLPYGTLGDRFPIWSCCQSNAKSWIMAYNESLDRIQLIVKTGSFTETVLTVLQSPARNTIIRTQVGRNGTEWRHGTSRTSAVGSGENIGFLQLGLGWSSMDSATGVRTSAAGLTLTGQIHVWQRFLSDANITALTADGGKYPWGYAH